MSKFTKALEKVQNLRHSGEDDGKTKSAFKIPPLDEVVEQRGVNWDAGATKVKNTTPDNRIVTIRFPESMVSEQYRLLRTSLRAQLDPEGCHVLLISSSLRNEGKTVTATNLAVSLAENEDLKVALVDCDLRRGDVAQYLGFGNDRAGLSDLLEDNLNPKKIMLRNSLANLFVIPRGKISKKPSELISSNRFSEFIAELRSHFDYIIIDSPPIMSVADAGILGRVADGVLFIIQIGRTPKSVVAHSCQLFKQAGTRMLGYVLTNVKYQSADYRYDSYYHYYGEKDKDEVGLKHRARRGFQRFGLNIKDAEDRFNYWWEKKTRGKKVKTL